MKKSWPQILLLIGFLLGAFGFTLAAAEGPSFSLVLFFVGVALFLAGIGAAIVRFAIRHRLVPHLLLLVAGLTLAAFVQHRYCFSLAYIRGAQENPYRLWISALKGLGNIGPVYYVGTEGKFSFFRAGTLFPDRFKAPTAKIKLPRTFPLASQKPYPVTAEMVNYSVSNKEFTRSLALFG